MMLRACTAVSLSCVLTAAALGTIKGPASAQPSITKTTKTSMSTVSPDKEMLVGPKAAKQQGKRLTPPVGLTPESLAITLGAKNLATFDRSNPDQKAELALLDRMMAQPARSVEVRPALTIAKTPTNQLVIPVDSQTGANDSTGRITFKFNNNVMGRAPLFPGERILSLTGSNLSPVEDIISNGGATVRQLIQKTPAELQAIEQTAFARSNRIQPDLASMMAVEFPRGTDARVLLATAKELNQRDDIEWVHIERRLYLHQEDVAGCLADNPDLCEEPSRVEDRMGPIGPMGTFACWDSAVNPITGQPNPALFPGACNPDPDCADPDADPSPCIFGCNDVNCCTTVGVVYPYCIDQESERGWDALCAAAANVLCDGSVYEPKAGVYDPCLSTYDPEDPTAPVNSNPVFQNVALFLNAPCGETHGQRGCNDSTCCAAVCVIDPSCCSDQWDTACVALTDEVGDKCTTTAPADTPTPSFTSTEAIDGLGQSLRITVGKQAYMRAEPVIAPFPQTPPLGSGTQANGDYEVALPLGNAWYSIENYIWSDQPNVPNQPAADGGVPAWNTDPPSGQKFDSSFLFSGFRGGGWDIPGVENMVGQLWANYGGGSFNNVLPNPHMVWLYGGEFEVGEVGVNSQGIEIGVGKNGRTYCRETCLDLGEIQAQYPDFFLGATTADPDTGIQANTLLCPTGNKVGVAVMEFAAFVNHEEFVCRTQDELGNCTETWPEYYDQLVANKQGNAPLPPASIGLPRVTPEDGQTMLLLEQSANEPQHGTACLGIVVAQDNGFGVNGMARNAQGYFFPIVSLEEGARETSAMASAIQTLPPGSSLNMSYGPGGGNVVTSDPGMYALVTVASDSLITTCISAGNDGVELAGEAGDDSGAIIVGACTPGTLLLPQGVCNDGGIAKMASCFSWASRWSGEVRESGPLLAVCAWGTSVTTVGYGDLFEGENTPSPGAEDLETNQLRTYTGPSPNIPTGGFNGTSSSAPQMTGAAAWIQGFAQMFYGQFLTSAQVRTVLASAGDYTCSGDPNSGGGLGIPGDIPEICQDFDPEETPRPIGRFPGGAFRDCAINVLVRLGQDFDGSVEIYTGQLVGGNSFSLGETDGNRLRIRSEFRGQGPGPSNLTYFGSGATIDFGVKFNTGYDPVVVENATLNVNAAAPAPLVIMIPFAFNHVTQRYDALGVEVITNVPTPYNYELGVVNGQQVIPASDYYTTAPNQAQVGVVDTRIYTLGLGYMGNQPLTGAWDEVSIETNVPFGGNDP